jgi:putative Holliday junction resolvase
MGFDFGTQFIGIAVGQKTVGSATPLKPIAAKEGQPNWDDLARIIKEWQPEQFVVGIPYNMDGSDSELSRRAARFGRRLEGRYGISWIGMDERLSSFDAKSSMQDSGTPIKGRIDSIAAKLILESWFRAQN